MPSVEQFFSAIGKADKFKNLLGVNDPGRPQIDEEIKALRFTYDNFDLIQSRFYKDNDKSTLSYIGPGSPA